MLERNYHKISTMDCQTSNARQDFIHSCVLQNSKVEHVIHQRKPVLERKGILFFCCLGYEFTLKHLIQIGDKPLSNSSWNRREHTRSSILDFDTKRAN